MKRIWSERNPNSRAGLIALLMAASMAACGGPDGPRPAEPNLGSVGVLLQVAPGLKLDAVSYTITGPGVSR